ncbi:MAG: ATP-binding cassette domain-containing protein [Gemmatimonadota bacterium]|nr:MAG: ATP-binding cassette domain-containing protein [Gemmatimonadota bacterium]
MQIAPEGPIREEEPLGKAYDARLMRRLLGYLRPYRLNVVVAVLMLILASGLELVGPWLTKLAIDDAIPEADYRLLIVLAVVYALALALSAALEYARTLLTTWIGQRVMKDLRGEIFSHLQRLQLSYFDRNPVGRTMTRVTSDVEVLNEMFTSGVVTIFGDVFTVLFIVGAMLALDWRLALVTFAVLPVVFLSAWLFRSKVRAAYRDIRLRLARINAFLQERINGMSVVQLFRTERPTLQRFRDLNEDHLEAHLRSITYYALFFPIVELLASVALALIIWYGGGQAIQGVVTIGVIAAFLQYARRFFRPIQDLSEKYNILQNAMASSERVFRLLDEEPGIREPEAPIHLPPRARGRIEFEGVWFHYGSAPAPALRGAPPLPDPEGGAEPPEVTLEEPARYDPDTPEAADVEVPKLVELAAAAMPTEAPAAMRAPGWVLEDVSFVAEPGERLAIVGATGAGKSTIINLIMRFYEPQRGRILLDGVDIREISTRELRSHMGLVLQDVYLFSGTAGENIRLVRPEVTDVRMREAARRVGINRHIERLPRGYAEELGERGSKLSVGERQLLSFARALAGDPQVLLLDEATSSVDSEIEAQIERALEELMSGRTSIVVAHRLSTVQNADRILVLHHGRIRESGTHRELLERGGLYARLHNLQFAGPTAAVS